MNKLGLDEETRRKNWQDVNGQGTWRKQWQVWGGESISLLRVDKLLFVWDEHENLKRDEWFRDGERYTPSAHERIEWEAISRDWEHRDIIARIKEWARNFREAERKAALSGADGLGTRAPG